MKVGFYNLHAHIGVQAHTTHTFTHIHKHIHTEKITHAYILKHTRTYIHLYRENKFGAFTNVYISYNFMSLPIFHPLSLSLSLSLSFICISVYVCVKKKLQ